MRPAGQLVVVFVLAAAPTFMACSRPREVARELPSKTRLLGAFDGRVYWASGQTLSWTEDALAEPLSFDVVGADWATRADFAVDSSGAYFSHHNKVSHVAREPERFSDGELSLGGWMRSSPAEHPTGLAIDGASIYVLALDVDCFDQGAVIGLSKANGDLLSRRSAPANGSQPVEFAIDGNFYYWIDGSGGEELSSRRDRKVMALPRRDGAAIVVAAREASTPIDLRIGGRGVYWRTRDGIRFARKEPNGFGAPSTLVDGNVQGSPAGPVGALLVDAGDVFFTTPDGIYWLPDGANQPRRIAKESHTSDLVGDGRFLYWMNTARRTLVRASRPKS